MLITRQAEAIQVHFSSSQRIYRKRKLKVDGTHLDRDPIVTHTREASTGTHHLVGCVYKKTFRLHYYLLAWFVCSMYCIFFLVKCSIYYTKILIFLQKNTEKLITELQKLNLNTKQYTKTGARLRQKMKSKQQKKTKQARTKETRTKREGPTVAISPREKRHQTLDAWCIQLPRDPHNTN